MPEALSEHLKVRAERSYLTFAKLISQVSPVQSQQFAADNWPDHKWGIGQDGSICGIVYHVAAWKAMTLPLFDPGGRPLAREEFDASQAPAPGDWEAIRAWYSAIGGLWNSRLQALSDADFDDKRDWEGQPMPVSSFIVEMMEHDIQHASQIEYLLQRIELESAS